MFDDLSITCCYLEVHEIGGHFDILNTKLKPLGLKAINKNRCLKLDYLRDLFNPIVCYEITNDPVDYIFFRRSYLQEIVQREGYTFKDLENNGSKYVISAILPTLEKDKNNKVLIKKD